MLISHVGVLLGIQDPEAAKHLEALAAAGLIRYGPSLSSAVRVRPWLCSSKAKPRALTIRAWSSSSRRGGWRSSFGSPRSPRAARSDPRRLRTQTQHRFRLLSLSGRRGRNCAPGRRGQAWTRAPDPRGAFPTRPQGTLSPPSEELPVVASIPATSRATNVKDQDVPVKVPLPFVPSVRTASRTKWGMESQRAPDRTTGSRRNNDRHGTGYDGRRPRSACGGRFPSPAFTTSAGGIRSPTSLSRIDATGAA